MGVRTRLFPATAFAIAALVVASSQAYAQDAAPARRTVITLNPLGIPFEYFSGELERIMTGLTTAGITASYLGLSDDSYATLEGKLRFYPNEEAPKGFSVGLSGGITRVEGEIFNGTDIDRTSETRPTIGVIIDYNWILGKTRRFLVGAGVGAKRIIGASGDIIDVEVGYPTARFQVGFLF
jgi:hypothetical protein